MLIWTVVLLAIVEGGIAVLLSRYVSVTRPESLVAIIGGQVLLMAGITFVVGRQGRFNKPRCHCVNPDPNRR